jgi:hypothetical protein
VFNFLKTDLTFDAAFRCVQYYSNTWWHKETVLHPSQTGWLTRKLLPLWCAKTCPHILMFLFLVGSFEIFLGLKLEIRKVVVFFPLSQCNIQYFIYWLSFREELYFFVNWIWIPDIAYIGYPRSQTSSTATYLSIIFYFFFNI